MAKELRDKLDAVQDDGSLLRERDAEIERLRELLKKHKLEVEIKENQVRTLKVKLEHIESEQLKGGSVRHEAEEEARALKAKLKRSEAQLKKALEALRKISRELGSKRPSACPTAAKPHLQSKLEDKQFYKDSVNILGMSIDELMDDFVQAPVWEQQV